MFETYYPAGLCRIKVFPSVLQSQKFLGKTVQPRSVFMNTSVSGCVSYLPAVRLEEVMLSGFETTSAIFMINIQSRCHLMLHNLNKH